MNILTFDIEEWFIEKAFHGGRAYRYREFDDTLSKVLDELDRLGIKATFFCVGQLAVDFPEVVRTIVARGHEVGCHSNVHTWLNTIDETILFQDTTDAIKVLEDVSGQRVISYRAPAFSLTEENKWVIPVLVDCGIEIDASVFPAGHDYGGYRRFPQDTPCKISYQGVTLKEFPVGMLSFLGKKIAYSGGGYFRLLPYWLVSRTMRQRDYNICYFHLLDLTKEDDKFMGRKDFEKYYKKEGTLKNRLFRYVKSNVGRGDAYGKLLKVLSNDSFVNIGDACKNIDWNHVNTVSL